MTITNVRDRIGDTLDVVTRYFKESDEGRAIVDRALSDQAAKAFAERQANGAELAAVERNESALHDAHQRALKPLQQREAIAAEQLARVRRDLETEVLTYRSASFALSARRTSLQSLIEQTAPPSIETFVDELNAEMDATLKMRDAIRGRNMEGYVGQVWSNELSVIARVVAIRDAVREVRGLKGHVLDEQALALQFELIRASFPALEGRPARFASQG